MGLRNKDAGIKASATMESRVAHALSDETILGAATLWVWFIKGAGLESTSCSPHKQPAPRSM